MKYFGLIFLICSSFAVYAMKIPVSVRRGLLLSKGSTTIVLSSPQATSLVLLNSNKHETVDLRVIEAGNEGWSAFELSDGENRPYASGFIRVVGRHTFHLLSQLAGQKPRPTLESLRNVIDALEQPCEPILINSQSMELLLIEDQTR